MARKSSPPLALHEVVRILGAEHAYLLLCPDSSSDRLVLRSARDAEGHEVPPGGYSAVLVERVRMSREAVAASGRADGTATLDGGPLPARHMLAAPLLLGHRLFGVVYLDRGLAGQPFTPDDVDILTAIGDHLALALEAAHTERLESERRALTRSQEAALDATRAKSAFIAHMSHELRTPLTAIIGYSELLEEEFQDQGESPYVPDVQRIQSAAKHLLALINNMLDLSKIEAGKMELHLEEFDLAEVLDEAVMAILPLLERGGNSFIRRVQPGMGPVWLDRMKVRQVLLNLLGNAAKFTTMGRIELDVTREVGRDGEVVVLRVQDTGIGMSEAQIKRIFEEFAQGSAATTRRYGGTGLGLAITRSFCQLMHGDIEVTSGLGEGSVFTVRLPAVLLVDEAARVDDDPAPGGDPRAVEAALSREEPADEGGGPMHSGTFTWPV
jgi:signal transduction histidine kinase